MATYREIHGKAIKSVSTDPSAETDAGQIWYNTTTDTFKSIVNLTAWTSGSQLSTAREGAAGFGLQTAAVICGGETPPVTNATEEYNGSGWTAGGTLNTARYRVAGCGTLTAGIVFGGAPVPPAATGAATETYNGTAWTTSPYTLNTPRNSLAGAGSSTSCLAMGGGPGYKNDSEEFDGEGWASTPNLNTAKHSSMAAGANAEGVISFGGYTSSPPTSETNATESWNGSSWTTVNNMNTGRYGGYGAGPQTAGIVTGGIVGPGTMQNKTETYDGTSWTETADLATSRGRLTSAGTTTAALAASGQTPSLTTATEEFNSSANAVTAAAWASGTAVNTGRYNGFSTASSPPSALLFFGGTYGIPGSSTNTGKTEEFNGTTWAEQTDMPGVTTTGGTGGTQTAAISMGGYQGASLIADCFSYNGSAWGTIPALPTATGNTKGCGTNTAGLLAGGKTPAAPSGTTATWEYDGEGWAAGGAMSTPRWQCAVYGIQTAAVASGGQGFIATTEEYGGSSWTSGGALITASGYLGSNGALADGLVYAGETSPAKLSTCVGYDGTAYSTRPSMATGRMGVGNGGGDTSATAVAISGDTPQSPSAMTTAVEEFTAETTAVNVKTLTQS